MLLSLLNAVLYKVTKAARNVVSSGGVPRKRLWEERVHKSTLGAKDVRDNIDKVRHGLILLLGVLHKQRNEKCADCNDRRHPKRPTKYFLFGPRTFFQMYEKRGVILARGDLWDSGEFFKCIQAGAGVEKSFWFGVPPCPFPAVHRIHLKKEG